MICHEIKMVIRFNWAEALRNKSPESITPECLQFVLSIDDPDAAFPMVPPVMASCAAVLRVCVRVRLEEGDGSTHAQDEGKAAHHVGGCS